MSDSDDAVSLGLHGRVASAVALEGGAMPVEGPAIGLDQESLPRPVGVRLVAEDGDVGLRPREVVLLTECEEAILERGTGRPRHQSGVDQRSDRA